MTKELGYLTISAMNAPAKRVCLTFDDGPNGEYTLQILDILEKHDKKALFFFPAKNIERQPNIALKVKAKGHLIGNHTYDHPHLNTLTKDQVLFQIEKSEEAFKSILGITPKYFRPPYGEYNKYVEDIIAHKDYELILWDMACCPMDWKNPPVQAIVDIIINRVSDGSIILLHDGRSTKADEPRHNTVNAVKEIIPIFEEKGFEIVTIDRLCKEKNR